MQRIHIIGAGMAGRKFGELAANLFAQHFEHQPLLFGRGNRCLGRFQFGERFFEALGIALEQRWVIKLSLKAYNISAFLVRAFP
jgi:hypothetical protein